MRNCISDHLLVCHMICRGRACYKVGLAKAMFMNFINILNHIFILKIFFFKFEI